MKRHNFDPISFVFGIVFAGLALLLWSERLELTGLGIEWIGAGVLLFLGASLLISSTRRSRD